MYATNMSISHCCHNSFGDCNVSFEFKLINSFKRIEKYSLYSFNAMSFELNRWWLVFDIKQQLWWSDIDKHKKPDDVNLLRARIVMEAELWCKDRPRRSNLNDFDLIYQYKIQLMVFEVLIVLELLMVLVLMSLVSMVFVSFVVLVPVMELIVKISYRTCPFLGFLLLGGSNCAKRTFRKNHYHFPWLSWIDYLF